MARSRSNRTSPPEVRGHDHAAKLVRHAPVAQLDRASVYGTEGREFESLRAYCTEGRKP
jgi:hypothetical protein